MPNDQLISASWLEAHAKPIPFIRCYPIASHRHFALLARHLVATIWCANTNPATKPRLCTPSATRARTLEAFVAALQAHAHRLCSRCALGAHSSSSRSFPGRRSKRR